MEYGIIYTVKRTVGSPKTSPLSLNLTDNIIIIFNDLVTKGGVIGEPKVPLK
jgi:hypothetical protein